MYALRVHHMAVQKRIRYLEIYLCDILIGECDVLTIIVKAIHLFTRVPVKEFEPSCNPIV